MSTLTNSASDAATQVEAYIASILTALGSRDPLEVLAEMPDALRRQAIGAPASGR